MGTVIEGPAEYSSRLTKKERKQTITEEVLADADIRSYTKNKYLSIQKEKSNKRKAFKVKKRDGKKFDRDGVDKKAPRSLRPRGY